MTRHSNQSIQQLINLRKSGLSLNELVLRTKLPKTTIWHHVQGIKLPDKFKSALRSNQGGSRKRMEQALKKAHEEATALLVSPKRNHVSLLAMLYWAEGHQKSQLIFTNTNGEMVALFIIFLEKCFKIKPEQISVVVRYYTRMDKTKCLTYWASITGVSKNKIKMYYNDGQKKSKSRFGICRVTIKKSSYLLKVIQSVIRNIVEELTPLSFNG